MSKKAKFPSPDEVERAPFNKRERLILSGRAPGVPVGAIAGLTPQVWVDGTHHPTTGYEMKSHQLHGGIGNARTVTPSREAQAAQDLERRIAAAMAAEQRNAPGPELTPPIEAARSLEHDLAIRAAKPAEAPARPDPALTHALEEDLSRTLHREVHLDDNALAKRAREADERFRLQADVHAAMIEAIARGQTVPAPTTADLARLVADLHKTIAMVAADMETLKLRAEAQDAKEAAEDSVEFYAELTQDPICPVKIGRASIKGATFVSKPPPASDPPPHSTPEPFLEVLRRRRADSLHNMHDLIARLEHLIGRFNGTANDTLKAASGVAGAGFLHQHIELNDWAEVLEDRLAHAVETLETLA